ncbi:ferredoxin, 4Fe-4S [Mycobacteroides abscessus 5S-0422]|uniref:4Fe-4S binding domain protein n=1 Tax=Mycobacteroides abscessus subsp. bolletii 1513 TaxID=1299321 RepID=X8DKP1_9MYCO|nr:(Fe-S)-binding protein [Mycobacteroides abscessus]EUA68045.1 4Fe-4S binding domain protein [Mycobacteroides abscessus subsp. bolletii 1513]EIU05461.1 ferredoxin, 4Fe-4S [Mycobacteroides abscessus 5S-0422]EIU07316.1 ferredoxin, 4Fe-4S [Mycobacteroides abscessus 5S-0421]EIU09033.1 ferredoxin, 4Fe-4S [Mycobacteroides abscessus 5S-0304]EIU22005.1 ferredoxin, 4Fe-4S [Mycobacteroides abscessus 5S-0708]
MSTATITLGIIGVIFSLVAWGSFFGGVVKMVRVILSGQPDRTRFRPFLPRLKQLIVEVVAHTRMNKFRTVGWAHWLVMVGFLGGFPLYFESYGQTFNPEFHWPIIGDTFLWHLWDELLGIGTVIGIVTLIIIRQLNHPRKPERLSRFGGSNFFAAYTIEMIVLVEGLGMVLVKSGKIATFHNSHPSSDFFTMNVAQLLPESPIMVSVFAFIKMMSGGLFLLLVGRKLVWGVAWHRFAAFFNIYFKRNADGSVALGAAKPMMSGGKVLEMESADPDVDAFGAGKVEDFSWKDLLDVTTCTECGRCQSQCPAWNTGKPLSPKLLITSLRDHTYAKAPYLLAGEDKSKLSEAEIAEGERQLVGGEGAVIDHEVLWSCTTCGACVEQCPVDIEHVDHIIDMRRYQVLIESEFPGELAGLFKNLENKGNPWGQNAKDRLNWIEEVDFDVPVFGQDVDSFADFEYLFWVGCAGAYEDRAKKTTKAVAELLALAGTKFLVLGADETCTGDSARRAGNEFLFQQLAMQNIELLNSVFEGVEQKQRKIVVTCAHCFNALGNEYPQVGGDYQVVHHTQLLNRLVRDKKLVPVAPVSQDVTYHDPCYLGRHNKVYTAPRELIGASGAAITEMPRHGERSMCCGAGGARMWMEEQLGKRINIDRVDEALSTPASKIATGCPFCRVMLTDGVTARDDSAAVEVVDVAQLLLESVGRTEDIRKALPAKGTAAAAAAERAATQTAAPEPVVAEEEAPATTKTEAAAPAAEAKPVSGLGMATGAKRPGAKKAAAPAEAAPATEAAPAPVKGLGMATGAKRPGAKKTAAETSTAEAPAATPTAEAAPAAPVKGLGMAAGAKRPGAKKATAETGAATPAAPASPPASQAPAAAAAPAPPVKGLGMAAGAKRPGAKKTAPAAPAAPAPEATAVPSESEAPATTETSAVAEPPVKGLGIAAGARRPGAKKAAPATESAPEPAQPAATASEPTEPATSAPKDEAPETGSTPEPPVKGLGIAPGARRPGRRN